MKLLEQYIEFTDDELDDAEKYIKTASEAKANGRVAEVELATRLATEELAHALSWHDFAVNCIERKRAELKAANIAVPEYMTFMWNKDHEEYIERVGRIKYKIEMLKR